VSFTSGRRPDTLAIWDITANLRLRRPHIVTMPQWFKQNGYFTQDIGKIYHNWHQTLRGDPQSWSVPQLMDWGPHHREKPVLPAGMPMPPNLARDRLSERRNVPDEPHFDGRVADLAVKALRG